MQKTLFAAIVGRPNTGKSTLLNAILGQKVAIVSSKPQTTRTRITGILTKEETQFVFLDTPGIHRPQDKLGSYMVKEANGAIGDVDAVLLVVQSGDRVGEVEKSIMKKVDEDTPLILVINKTDISNAAQIAETIVRFSAEREFSAVVPISAKNNEGVEFIIDDTPEAITVSSFDPVRREIARLTLERLIQDGRIHPTKIEELYEKSKREVEYTIKQEGEKAVLSANCGSLHPELVKLLGKLKYRTSYGQSVLRHSLEVSYIAGLMAAELGADEKTARRAGLLHDIGKALDHEFEGSHVALGVEYARKYKENETILNAIQAHHGEVECKTVVACLVQAADAVSASRPGARRENIENYIKRLQQLEEISTSFNGVEKAFALQAGREVRVMVKPEKIKDNRMPYIAREIAKKIEAEMEYPGQIKVNIIRESRAFDVAK